MTVVAIENIEAIENIVAIATIKTPPNKSNEQPNITNQHHKKTINIRTNKTTNRID